MILKHWQTVLVSTLLLLLIGVCVLGIRIQQQGIAMRYELAREQNKAIEDLGRSLQRCKDLVEEIRLKQEAIESRLVKSAGVVPRVDHEKRLASAEEQLGEVREAVLALGRQGESNE